MIILLQADITTLAIDAIINAANNSLLGGGGVDGAIHRAAGPALLAACRPLSGCATGEAKITPGFELAASYVIHTVGPVWQGGEQGEAELLISAYQCSFDLALKHSIETIAFPAISTGVYAYPKMQAAMIALSKMKHYETQFKQIYAVCHGNADFEIYQQALGKIERQ